MHQFYFKKTQPYNLLTFLQQKWTERIKMLNLMILIDLCSSKNCAGDGRLQELNMVLFGSSFSLAFVLFKIIADLKIKNNSFKQTLEGLFVGG